MKRKTMKRTSLLATLTALLSVVLLSSCSSDDYSPIQANPKTCGIEIECNNTGGENLLADKDFVEKIKVEGESSHSIVPHTVSGNRLIFDAELPDRNDMKWTGDRREATGMSKMTVRFGKEKVTLKCYFKYIANRPPAASGGSITLEQVEYNGHTYQRTGNIVTIRVQFNKNGKL